MPSKEKNTSKKNSVKKKAGFTKKKLKTIREELISKKAQILEELMRLKGDNLNKTFKDASGDLSGYSFHMADMATDLYDREFSLELAEGERERLFALDDAIKRIDEGSYGRCDSCGAAITKMRLKVMPQAKYCITCQENEEKSTGK